MSQLVKKPYDEFRGGMYVAKFTLCFASDRSSDWSRRKTAGKMGQNPDFGPFFRTSPLCRKKANGLFRQLGTFEKCLLFIARSA